MQCFSKQISAFRKFYKPDRKSLIKIDKMINFTLKIHDMTHLEFNYFRVRF